MTRLSALPSTALSIATAPPGGARPARSSGGAAVAFAGLAAPAAIDRLAAAPAGPMILEDATFAHVPAPTTMVASAVSSGDTGVPSPASTIDAPALPVVESSNGTTVTPLVMAPLVMGGPLPVNRQASADTGKTLPMIPPLAPPVATPDRATVPAAVMALAGAVSDTQVSAPLTTPPSATAVIPPSRTRSPTAVAPVTIVVSDILPDAKPSALVHDDGSTVGTGAPALASPVAALPATRPALASKAPVVPTSPAPLRSGNTSSAVPAAAVVESAGSTIAPVSVEPTAPAILERVMAAVSPVEPRPPVTIADHRIVVAGETGGSADVVSGKAALPIPDATPEIEPKPAPDRTRTAPPQTANDDALMVIAAGVLPPVGDWSSASVTIESGALVAVSATPSASSAASGRPSVSSTAPVSSGNAASQKPDTPLVAVRRSGFSSAKVASGGADPGKAAIGTDSAPKEALATALLPPIDPSAIVPPDPMHVPASTDPFAAPVTNTTGVLLPASAPLPAAPGAARVRSAPQVAWSGRDTWKTGTQQPRSIDAVLPAMSPSMFAGSAPSDGVAAQAMPITSVRAAPLSSAAPSLPDAIMPTDLAMRPAIAGPSGLVATGVAAPAALVAPSLPPGVTGTMRSTLPPAAPAAPATATGSAAIAQALFLPNTLPASGAAGRVFAAALHAASGLVVPSRDNAPAQHGDAPDPMVAALLASVAPTQASAAAGASATIDLHDAGWPTQMAQRIEALRDGADATSTRVRISPDLLGSVDLQIRRDGDRLHVHFAAANPETRTLIADAQPQLATAAADRGLKLGQTSVGVGGAGAGSNGQSWTGDQPARQPVAPLHSARSTRPATAGATAGATDADTDTRIA